MLPKQIFNDESNTSNTVCKADIQTLGDLLMSAINGTGSKQKNLLWDALGVL